MTVTKEQIAQARQYLNDLVDDSRLNDSRRKFIDNLLWKLEVMAPIESAADA